MALVIKPITAAQLQQVQQKLSAIPGTTMTETAPEDYTITNEEHKLTATAAFDPNEDKLTVIVTENHSGFPTFIVNKKIQGWIQDAMKEEQVGS
jgi:hypothetical protein